MGLLDEEGNRVYKAKVPNFLPLILNELELFRRGIVGIVVESTFNWYWLVDGLMEAGYKVHLANPSAIKQYEGLKHTDDYHDAFHLANLLRLGILSEGHIYPKQEQGEGNRKNGKKYLGWAFVEAANYAKRYCPNARRFYQRKLAKTKKVVAIKALAHKLARASYFVMRDRVDYDPQRSFG